MNIKLKNCILAFAKQSAPTDYVEVKGVGTSSQFSTGDYFIGTQSLVGLQRKTEDGYEPAANTISDGTLLKLKDTNVYFVFDSSKVINYQPYFNLDVKDISKNTAQTYADGQITSGTSSSYAGGSCSLRNGQTIYVVGAGGTGVKSLVKGVSGVNTIVFDDTYKTLHSYTATEDCIVYYNTKESDKGWVAIAKA